MNICQTVTISHAIVVLFFAGCKLAGASTCHLIPMQSEDESAIPNQTVLVRPDMLLGSNCFGHIDNTEDEAMVKDAIGTLIDDFTTDCKQRDTTGSSSAQGYLHHEPFAWNTMSSV